MGKHRGLLALHCRVLALVVSALALACPAHAATTSGTAQATILTPMSLVNTDTLRFGNLFPGASAGTVTINPFTEARTTTGGVIPAGGIITAGKFMGMTDGTTHLKIDVPNGSITLFRVGGGATMTANSFTINGNKNNWVPSGVILTFNVGARLMVGANQMTGRYVGTYNVTVNYR